MRQMLAVVVMFLLSINCHAQVVLGEEVPPNKLADAKATIKAAEPKLLKLNVDEFEVIEPSKTLTVPLQWLSTRSTCIERHDIAAGETFSIIAKRAGDTVRKRHRFEPKPFPWTIAIGVTKGTTDIFLNRNGDAAKKEPPVLVAELLVVVDGGSPDPDPDPIKPPVENDLVKSLKAAYALDFTQGKGSKEIAQKISDIYEGLAATQFNLPMTHKEMNKIIYDAMTSRSIPPPETVLLNTRTAIQAYLFKVHGISQVDSQAALTADGLTKAKTAYAEIGKALDAVAK